MTALRRIAESDAMPCVSTGILDLDSQSIFSNDGTRLVTWHRPFGSTLWNPRDGSKIKDLAPGPIDYAAGTCSITSDQQFAEIVHAGVVSFYRLADGTLDHEISLGSGAARAVSGDGASIACVDAAGTLFLIDTRTGLRRFATPVAKSRADVGIVQMTADGSRIIIALGKSVLSLADALTGAIIKSSPVPWAPTAAGDLQTLAFQSPDGRFVVMPEPIRLSRRVSLVAVPPLYVFDSHGLNLLGIVPGTIPHGCQPFSPDGRRMVADDAQKLVLYDTATWKPTSAISAGSAPAFTWLSNGSLITTGNDAQSVTNVQLWTRHRPEAWWGVAVLPQFWLALVATLFTLARIRADLRRWYHPAVPVLPPTGGG
jgi:hypothetical protein